MVGWLEVAVLVDDLPLAVLAPVGMRQPDGVGRQRSAVHAHAEPCDAGGPRDIAIHIERDELVADVAAAGEPRRDGPEGRLEHVPPDPRHADRRDSVTRS
jgi:hypothetical protein